MSCDDCVASYLCSYRLMLVLCCLFGCLMLLLRVVLPHLMIVCM